METNSKTSKIKSYLTNPIIIFSILTAIFAIILYFGCNFHLPDYYIDRNAAHDAAQISDAYEASLAVESYENIKYKIFNPIFQLFGLSLSLLFFSIIFRTKNIQIFKNRIFIYLWINLSYIIYAIIWTPVYMINLEKYVYNGMHDSMGIPYFSAILTSVFTALIYYPVFNTLFFIVYNTKINRLIYSIILWIIGLKILFDTVLTVPSMKFTYWHILLNFINFVWLGIIFAAIKTMKDKRKISEYSSDFGNEVTVNSQTNC